MKRRFLFLAALLGLTSAVVFASDNEFLRLAQGPSVSVASVAPVAVAPGKSARLAFAFRVQPGFHINSNQPKSNLLLPTALHFDPPSDILVGKVRYPRGKDFTFQFAPDEKLNVYTGDFSVTALVSTVASVASGRYRVHGALKYQACDNRQCYPPKQVPVSFDVTVRKSRRRSGNWGRNPGQSPHIHN